MNDIQNRWIEIAKELRNSTNTREKRLEKMIKDNRNKYIRLVFDSQKTELTMHSFNISGFDDPEREMHDNLFDLADALYSLPASENITQTLISNLADSLMKSFAL